MRFPGWLIGIPVALVISLFAVSNRAPVAMALWPLPDTVEAPLYLVVLAAVLLGFVWGAGAATVARRGREKK